MLEVCALSKLYNSQPILNNVSIQIPDSAKLVGIIGPNGAGKTTLLEVLAGLISKDSGEILWNGTPITQESRKQILFYFSDSSFPDYDRSINEIFSFYKIMYQVNEELFLRTISELELKENLNKRFSQLSKGFKKRVLIALSFLVPHPLVILDEPFDGFDFKQTKNLISLLKTKEMKKKTFIFSIHQLADAEKLCDYFILLNQGSVLSQKTEPGQLEEVFLALS